MRRLSRATEAVIGMFLGFGVGLVLDLAVRDAGVKADEWHLAFLLATFGGAIPFLRRGD